MNMTRMWNLIFRLSAPGMVREKTIIAILRLREEAQDAAVVKLQKAPVYVHTDVVEDVVNAVENLPAKEQSKAVVAKLDEAIDAIRASLPPRERPRRMMKDRVKIVMEYARGTEEYQHEKKMCEALDRVIMWIQTRGWEQECGTALQEKSLQLVKLVRETKHEAGPRRLRLPEAPR